MIITDFNKMSLEELEIIHNNLGLTFDINNGKIDEKEKSLPMTAKSEQG